MRHRCNRHPPDFHLTELRFPIDPYGHYLTKPVWDEETIIYAELDMSLPAACKMEHDAIGHYARPDILELKVNEK